jgi:chromosome segregation ATPase
MSITIEQDLKEILAKLDQKLDGLQKNIDQKFESLQKDIVDLKVGQTEVKGEIKTLGERINGLDERVKSQDFINRGILVGLILAILGGLAKLFGFVGNP